MLQAQQINKRLTASSALRASLRSGRRIQPYSPRPKGGGVSFFDLGKLNENPRKSMLQVALLIDGTSSMGSDFSELKNELLEFLKAIPTQSGIRSEKIDVAIVVYRDWLDDKNSLRSSPVEFASNVNESSRGFLSLKDNPDTIRNVINGIKQETDGPGAPEQVDRGIYFTLTRLRWSRSRQSARVMLIVGDSSPWSEAYIKSSPSEFKQFSGETSLRGHSTKLLVKLVKDTGINVYAIRSESTQQPSTHVDTNRFFEQITAALNLTQPSLHDHFSDLDQLTLIEMNGITKDEIESRRKIADSKIAVRKNETSKLLQSSLAFHQQTEIDDDVSKAIKRLQTAAQGRDASLATIQLSDALYRTGKKDDAHKLLKSAVARIDAASRSDLVNVELIALHSLFNEKKPLQAAEQFETILKKSPSPTTAACQRATWMLIRLYLGELGAHSAMKQKYEEPTKRYDLVRDHVLNMLVFWPQSAEAKYFASFVSPQIPGKDEQFDGKLEFLVPTRAPIEKQK
ncbi:MAG: hypothetical protein CMJ78_06985 [Planctomycetaceae bacterium]|nr:hypothetical protein [Planctomycetaceae bacterium]